MKVTMKEILKWAATAMSAKGGYRRPKERCVYNSDISHRGAIKASFGEMRYSSSDISFRWDLGSCSTFSSSTSHLSLTEQHWDDTDWQQTWVRQETEECPTMGHWITTDPKFVVLEF